jgi:general secretion pathway protein G
MTRSIRHNPSRQGFSLIEILVVLAIIAILVSLVIGIAGGVQRGAAESKAKAEIASLMTELEKYKEDKGTYPSNLTTDFIPWYTNTYYNAIYNLTDFKSSGSNKTPIDPWGKDYYYNFNASNNPNVYQIGSRGADGRLGSQPDPDSAANFGKGDDITNRNGSL